MSEVWVLVLAGLLVLAVLLVRGLVRSKQYLRWLIGCLGV